MFYSQLLLAKKGPLGKLWLAGHYSSHKKLNKQQIFNTNITVSVDLIIHPSAPIALRTSGHLMLGVVRIYSKKVEYFVTDCEAAMFKVKTVQPMGGNDLENDMPAVDERKNDDIDLDLDDMMSNFDSTPLVKRAGKLDLTDAWAEARTRTLAPQEDITQEDTPTIHESLGQRLTSPFSARRSNRFLDIPDFMAEDGDDRGSHSKKRVSDIEVMRGEESLGTSISGPSLLFEEELPPFRDNGFEPDLFQTLHDDLAQSDPLPLPMEDVNHPNSPAVALPESPNLNISVSTIHTDHAEQEASVVDPSRVDAPVLNFNPDEEGTEPRAPKRRKVVVHPRKRRRMIVIDTAVELSSAQIRAQMHDTSSIERPRIADRAMRSQIQWKPNRNTMVSLPAFGGLAPSLVTLFKMVAAPGALPLLRKRPRPAQVGDAEDVELARRESSIGAYERDGISADEILQHEADEVSRSSLLAQTQADLDPGIEPMMDNDVMDVGLDMGLGVGEDPPIDFDEEERKDEALEQADEATANETLEGSPMTRAHSYVQGKMHPHTKKVLNTVRKKLATRGVVTFAEVSRRAKRRVAASCFFEVLQLRTWGVLHTEQAEAFGDIVITPGPKFGEDNDDADVGSGTLPPVS